MTLNELIKLTTLEQLGPDEKLHNVAFDLGLHALLRLSVINTLGKYSTLRVNMVWTHIFFNPNNSLTGSIAH